MASLIVNVHQNAKPNMSAEAYGKGLVLWVANQETGSFVQVEVEQDTHIGPQGQTYHHFVIKRDKPRKETRINHYKKAIGLATMFALEMDGY